MKIMRGPQLDPMTNNYRSNQYDFIRLYSFVFTFLPSIPGSRQAALLEMERKHLLERAGDLISAMRITLSCKHFIVRDIYKSPPLKLGARISVFRRSSFLPTLPGKPKKIDY